jgi:MFS family permease
MIYSVLVLSDGFRGPFLWPIYKSYGINDHEIYIMYAITFFSSAIFSSISGDMADRWSKSYTLALACIIDGISCLARFSTNLNILMVGHVLSGISFCTLFPTLESWMIEKHEKAEYSQSQLQQTLAATSLFFGLVEICCGIGANLISDYYGYSSLLYLSAIFMIISFKLILNYDSPENQQTIRVKKTEFESTPTNTPNLMIIGLMQAGFEILLTVFISIWAPAIGKATKGNANYGYIFSSFMVSVMIGSKIYSFLSRKLSDNLISSITFGVSMASMMVCGIFSDSALMLMLAFNLFEISFGIYMPCIGSLRSKLLPPDRRTYLMNVLKIPIYTIGAIAFIFMNDIEQLGSHIIWFALAGLALISLIASVFLEAKSKYVLLPMASVSSIE